MIKNVKAPIGDFRDWDAITSWAAAIADRPFHLRGYMSLPGLLTAIEEFGWRGYLAPKVYKLGLNAFVAHVVVGMIWGGWHIPYFSVFWSHSMQNMPLFVLCFFLGAIASSIVYGEIRMQTDSVWPAFLMHAVSNAVNNTLVLQGFIKMTSGKELLASPGIEGILGIVFLTLVGVGIHRLTRKGTAAV